MEQNSPVAPQTLLEPDRAAAEPVASSSPFPPPAVLPTQAGPGGIRFDFNQGARLALPEGAWRVCLRDLDTGAVLFAGDRGGVTIQSGRRHFVRFGIEVWDVAGSLAFEHRYDAGGRPVLISFPLGTLGDTLGWLPYAARFQARHRCRLSCAVAERHLPLFAAAYPDLAFVTHERVEPDRFYATYDLALFFDDADCEPQPTDAATSGCPAPPAPSWTAAASTCRGAGPQERTRHGTMSLVSDSD